MFYLFIKYPLSSNYVSLWFIQKQTEERNPVIEIHLSSSAKARWPLWISCFTTFIMWEKAAVFFHILFWKFLKKGKIKDKRQPLEFTDHRSAVFFLLNRDHEDYYFHFLNRFAFLFVPFISRDSFSHCYLGPSAQSFLLQFRSSLACSWSQWPLPGGKDRADFLTSKRRKKSEEEEWHWSFQVRLPIALSVFLTLLIASSSWVTAEPVPGLPGQHIASL